MSYQWDLAGRRTRVTWPDALYAQYDYDLSNALTGISENGSTSLASYAYDNLGRRTGVTRGNGTTESATFDPASRLTQLVQNLTGTGDDLTIDLTYDAAGGIVTRTLSNSAYQWTPLASSATAYADNGLNQYTSIGGTSQAYDSRGNLTTGSYTYDIYNRLITGPSSATLAYDPAGRLYETVGGGVTTRVLYDGVQVVGEFNSGGTLQRRYVPGPSLDRVVAWYEGAGTSDRRWLAADERSSVVAVVSSSGVATTKNTYDEYGLRGGSNAGRFQFTGQPWLPEVSLYHYRARAYSATLGRFMQPDPALSEGGSNLYAYVQNDPINLQDPMGLQDDGGHVEVTQRRCNSVCRHLVQQIIEAARRNYGRRASERLRDTLVGLIDRAECPAAEVGFAVPGIFEGLFSPLPGNYTFTKLSAQATYFGTGLSFSGARYTNETTGAQTYNYSISVFTGFAGNGPLRNWRDFAGGVSRIGAAGIGLTYGTASDPAATNLTGGVTVIGTPFSGEVGGSPEGAFEAGIGGGLGWALGFTGTPADWQIQIECEGESE